MAGEERRLEREGEALDRPAGARLVLDRERPLGDAVERRVACQADLVEERLDRLRIAGGRAQHVEADDVARALPDREERLLPVDPREARRLDEAVAAEAFERLRRVARAALADPVL